MTTFVVGAKQFQNKLHAQWSQFLASLQIEHQVITEKSDAANGVHPSGEPNPTFWLPKYHTIDGIYLWVVGSEGRVGRGEIPVILKSGKQPLWAVNGVPDAVVSYLWWLDEFDNPQRISVLPGFGAAYVEHKLFTEPRAVDSTGRVRSDVLKRHGAPLVKALADSRGVREVGEGHQSSVISHQSSVQSQKLRGWVLPSQESEVKSQESNTRLRTNDFGLRTASTSGLWFGDEESHVEFVGNADGSVEIRVGESRYKLSRKQFDLVLNYFNQNDF